MDKSVLIQNKDGAISITIKKGCLAEEHTFTALDKKDALDFIMDYLEIDDYVSIRKKPSRRG